MLGYATFAIGFATGWTARGTTHSSRAAFLSILAAMLSTVDQLKRRIAIERDHLEDWIAEARARADVVGREHAWHNGSPGSADRYDEAAA